MKKLFSRKAIKVFVPLLIAFFLAGSGLMVGQTYFGAKAEGMIEAEKGDDGKKSELTDKIVSWVSNALSSFAEKQGVDLGDTDKKDAKQEVTYSPAVQKVLSKQKSCLISGIVSYGLCLVFVGMSIAAAAYSSYLLSDKYKAKLRRQEVGERRRSMMK